MKHYKDSHDKTYGFEEDEQTIAVQFTREDLANMVGTATESLIRTLSDFKAEGLVALKGSHIQILKPDALQHIKG